MLHVPLLDKLCNNGPVSQKNLRLQRETPVNCKILKNPQFYLTLLVSLKIFLIKSLKPFSNQCTCKIENNEHN
jgi:hypothetical protein